MNGGHCLPGAHGLSVDPRNAPGTGSERIKSTSMGQHCVPFAQPDLAQKQGLRTLVVRLSARPLPEKKRQALGSASPPLPT